MEASALQAPAGIARTRISLSGPLLRLRSDDQLIALFRAGNEDSFSVIHDRYKQRLLAYTRQMLSGSGPDAEDAVQDVFLRAYSALRASQRPISLRAWLYRVAHNRCIDQLRRPVPAPADIFEVSRPPAPSIDAEVERREDLRRLVADVGRLPTQQRSVLLMREMEGLSYSDLAGALEVSVPAVKSLLVRARMGLVQAAEARDVACHEIRSDLAASHDRGVRATGRARRHLRDCAGCRDYRSDMRHAQRQLHGLAPSIGLMGLVAKLFSGGAAAGGSAAASTGGIGAGAVTAGGAATATKVAAVVCCAALATGGAVEVQRHIVEPAQQDGPTLHSLRRALHPVAVTPATTVARPSRSASAARSPAQAAPSGAASTTTGKHPSQRPAAAGIEGSMGPTGTEIPRPASGAANPTGAATAQQPAQQTPVAVLAGALSGQPQSEPPPSSHTTTGAQGGSTSAPSSSSTTSTPSP